MNKVYVVRFGKPRALPADKQDLAEWRYPFTVVEKTVVGKPDEKTRTVQSEVRIVLLGGVNIPSVIDEHGSLVDISEEDHEKIIYEHSRSFVIGKIKEGWDLQKHIVFEIGSVGARAEDLPKLDPARTPNPDGIEIEIEIPQQFGFRS